MSRNISQRHSRRFGVGSQKQQKKQEASAGPRRRPGLEWLETRTLLANFSPLAAAADGAVDSLRAAITTANTNTQNDTITLQAGTYELTLPNAGGLQENANATGDLDVAADGGFTLTINGAGINKTFIDANQLDRVMQALSGSHLTLSNLTLTGGQARDNGATGAAAGSTAAFGGGLLSLGGNVTVQNVSLKTNVALGEPGGVFIGAAGGNGQNAFGGGLYADAGTLSLT